MGQAVYDVIIIGSGFGGCMSAWPLVHQGYRVLMLERGDWVERGPHNWGPEGSVYFTPYYSEEEVVAAGKGRRSARVGTYHCVGGPSVFFGGVCLRFREQDFEPAPEIVGDSAAAWPIGYRELEPFYSQAEQLLDVAGASPSGDPTEPQRSRPYPQPPVSLSDTSRRIASAARELSLNPFPLPLAINFRNNRATPCIQCTTCDTFACAIGAKNDLATRIIPALLKKGMELKTGVAALRLLSRNRRITGVECWDQQQQEKVVYRARLVLLAAGALGSPHLVLASGLEAYNPAGRLVGHYLMRHCNAIVYGFFPDAPARENRFHKQLGIHDFYFGHPEISEPAGKLGSLQQVQTPPASLVQAMLPPGVGKLITPAVQHLTGLVIQAEDQPVYENHLSLDRERGNRYGMPRLVIHHRYTRRDLAARKALVRQAVRILKKAGARFCYVHKINTFSHAVGTLRMGRDPETSVLNEVCQFRGIENLYVVDGSVMPTSAAVNPSLTISANALRVGHFLAENFPQDAP
ncbi:MAG: GMC family oxidoreductase [Calditrichaeota bacterium]|nr:MAG: GMC family oxidoreductase [Calditrichota bacterium]